MPYTLSFDPAHGVIVGTGTGTLTLYDAREGAVSVWERREWKGKPMVWDFRSARFDVTGDSVREFARFVTDHQPWSRPPRVALVTGTEVDFGMARMFEAFREDFFTEVRVFSDYDEGIAWASEKRVEEREIER